MINTVDQDGLHFTCLAPYSLRYFCAVMCLREMIALKEWCGLSNHTESLLFPTDAGLYCPAGDFYIDPLRPVSRALITHAHADHARSGHQHVMATQKTLDIMVIRYGDDFCKTRAAAVFGKSYSQSGIDVTFHPAGHVLGSAQISLEIDGVRFVVSGDYKRLQDPTAEAFEPVECDVFITEATFGLPVFHHPDPRQEINKLIRSIFSNKDRSHMVGVYALGKAQRVIRLLRDCGYDRPVYLHGALVKLCDYYQSQGVDLGDLVPVTDVSSTGEKFAGEVILAPPSSFNSPWIRRFADPVICFASGWMHVRQRAKQRGVELPLVISDHCDWSELIRSISDTKASEVWVTHGREDALVRWCELNQIWAKPLHLVGYDDEAE